MIYYYETEEGEDVERFQATSDDEALSCWTDGMVILYREIEGFTGNGLPYVILKQKWR